nr:aldo/keto reductase [Phytoactinopolyspora alkaliphila]
MKTASLGSTGMEITRVGFGAWAIGGDDWTHGWGAQADDDSVAAIRYAVEAGVNWIDTAAVYGLGHSEEVVARALKGIPENDRPYVFTKGGLVWDPADRSAGARRVGEPASLRREVEASLRRLDVDRIDLYQMHWPTQDGTPVEEYWQTFVELKDEGKVRAIGLSNHDTKQLDRAEAIGHVDSLQPPFSMIRRDAAADVIPWCEQHDTGVIVYSPMASGLLTGTFTTERAASLGPTDWRSRSSDFTGEGLQRNLALVDDLRPIAARKGVSVAALSVAWTLAFRGVTGAIVGARRPDQIDGWVPAADVALDEDDLDDIAAAIRSNGIGDELTRP